MRAIVTGGAGFIGSALTRHLISNLSWSVLVLDKLTYAGHLSSLSPVANTPKFAFRQIDICQRDALDDAFKAHQPDVVFHLAAESHVDRSITHAGAFVETNVMGTFNLLEASRAYWSKLASDRADDFRFLHVSTDEVFGSLGTEGLFCEETPYDPRSPYSASKAASDHLVRAWSHTYNLPVLISNCSNNYGPYQLPEKLIPTIILKALHGENIPVYGNGSNIRDWLYVDDHVTALCLIAQKGALGRTYNVGGRNERTNLQVVNAVCELLDRRAGHAASHRDLVDFVADRPGHDHRYAIDASRLEDELGWRAQASFETGIERTVQWYLDSSDWWAPLRKGGIGVNRQGLLAADPNS